MRASVSRSFSNAAAIADIEPREGEPGTVDQAVDVGLELDEEAEVGPAHDLAGELGAGRVALGDALPGIGLERLHRQRDPVAFNPAWQGHRLDVCLRWGTDCSKPAADAFCGAKGFPRSFYSVPDAESGYASTRVIAR